MAASSISRLDRSGVLVVRTLLWFGSSTRQRLSYLTGFTRGQTNRLLEDLSARGWIGFAEERHIGVGRPAAQVVLSPSLGHFLAVTLEDDEVKVTLARSDLQRVGTRSFGYSFALSPTKLLNALGREIRSLFSDANISPRKLLSMAVSAPGPVEALDPPIFRPHPSLGWHGFDIAAYLKGTFRKPVFIDNDANLSTMGELLWSRSNGKSAGKEDWLVVKMNTSGIGAGIVSNGLVHRGATGLAGEIGHIQVQPAGPQCTCGLKGCLESVASPPVLLERARLNFQQVHPDGPQSQASARNNFSWQELERAVQSGDEFANSLLLEAGTRLGSVVAGAVSTLNPAKVLVAGRVARVAPSILASIRQGIYGCSFPNATHAIDVEYIRNSEAEIDGALVYAFEKLIDTQCSTGSLRPVLSVIG